MALPPKLQFPPKAPGQYLSHTEFNMLTLAVDGTVTHLETLPAQVRDTPLVADQVGVEFEYPDTPFNPSDPVALNLLRVMGRLKALAAQPPPVQITPKRLDFTNADKVHIYHPDVENAQVVLHDSSGKTFRAGAPQPINPDGLQDARYTLIRWLGKLNGYVIVTSNQAILL